MRVIFLDIDGVLALPKQYSTNRTKLRQKDPNAAALNIPYYWDERCVKELNILLMQYDMEIVVSSDWKLHWNMEDLRKIFALNGVAKKPIGFTHSMKYKMSSSLESDRVKQIQDWIEQNKVTEWCAIDDMDLKDLGSRFVQTDERMGIAQKGMREKLLYALFPSLHLADHGICA